MQQMTEETNRTPKAAGMQQFDAVYERMILGRSFVEYKDYYHQARGRFKRTAGYLDDLPLQPGARHLDIGGGQMALLGRDLFGFSPFVGDVVETAAQDIVSQGVEFQRVNLMDDAYEADDLFDVITLLEVIEHIPRPPYITFEKLRKLLKPGGYLVLTTPNGFRIRNILRMLANKEVLDLYRYPNGDEALGHQHEYTVRQMQWQIQEAGLDPLVCQTFVSGWRGASPSARLAHIATKPFNLAPHLRDSLVAVAQAPSG